NSLNHLVYNGAGKLAPAPCSFVAAPEVAPPSPLAPPHPIVTMATPAHSRTNVGIFRVIVILRAPNRGAPRHRRPALQQDVRSFTPVIVPGGRDGGATFG